VGSPLGSGAGSGSGSTVCCAGSLGAADSVGAGAWSVSPPPGVVASDVDGSDDGGPVGSTSGGEAAGGSVAGDCEASDDGG
jgi:hypothetical protein